MNKFIKKSIFVLMSALTIGSAVCPAMAADTTNESLPAVAKNSPVISPMTTSLTLTTTSSVSSIIVRWNAVTGASKYVVTCGSTTQTKTAFSATFTGLQTKTTYQISVKAYNSAGNVIASTSTTATTT